MKRFGIGGILSFLIFVISTWNAIAADQEASITRIEISGLKRTRESALRRIIEVSEGAPCTGETEEKIRQNILKKGIFRANTLEISREQDVEGCRVVIFVEDKWTLIPVPIFFATEGLWRAGISVAELNFLGQGFMVFGSFIGGDEYINAGLGTRFYDTTIITNYGQNKREDISTYGDKKETLRKFKLDSFRITIIQNLLFRDSWLLAGRLSFRHTEVSAGEWQSAPTVAGHTALIAGPRIRYQGQRIEGAFRLGLDAGLAVNYITPNYFTLKGNANYALLLWGNRLSLSMAGATAIQPSSFGYFINSRPGSLTLPSGVYAHSWLNSEFRVERALLNLKWGSIVASLMYEGGLYSDALERTVLHHGPGVGLFLYLDTVAIPAMSFSVSWNVPLNRVLPAFNVAGRF